MASKKRAKVETSAPAAALREESIGEAQSNVTRLTAKGAWSNAQVEAKAAEYFSGTEVARRAVKELAAAYQDDLVTAAQLNRVFIIHKDDDSGEKFVRDFKEACSLMKSSSRIKGPDGKPVAFKTVQKGRGKEANTLVEFHAPMERNVNRNSKQTVAVKVRRMALELKGEDYKAFKALILKQFEEIEAGATK